MLRHSCGTEPTRSLVDTGSGAGCPAGEGADTRDFGGGPSLGSGPIVRCKANAEDVLHRTATAGTRVPPLAGVPRVKVREDRPRLTHVRDDAVRREQRLIVVTPILTAPIKVCRSPRAGRRSASAMRSTATGSGCVQRLPHRPPHHTPRRRGRERSREPASPRAWARKSDHSRTRDPARSPGRLGSGRWSTLGASGCACGESVVRRPAPTNPSSRISRATRFWAGGSPWVRSAAWTRGAALGRHRAYREPARWARTRGPALRRVEPGSDAASASPTSLTNRSVSLVAVVLAVPPALAQGSNQVDMTVDAARGGRWSTACSPGSPKPTSSRTRPSRWSAPSGTGCGAARTRGSRAPGRWPTR